MIKVNTKEIDGKINEVKEQALEASKLRQVADNLIEQAKSTEGLTLKSPITLFYGQSNWDRVDNITNIKIVKVMKVNAMLVVKSDRKYNADIKVNIEDLKHEILKGMK